MSILMFTLYRLERITFGAPCSCSPVNVANIINAFKIFFIQYFINVGLISKFVNKFLVNLIKDLLYLI